MFVFQIQKCHFLLDPIIYDICSRPLSAKADSIYKRDSWFVIEKRKRKTQPDKYYTDGQNMYILVN